LMREFTKITPAVALKNLVVYNNTLQTAISERIGMGDYDKWWGVDILKAEIKLINFSKSLNKEIQSMAEATAKKRAAITVAEGKKESDKLEGEGKGAAEEATLRGRTAGLEHMAEKLKVHGSLVLGAETARGITNNAGQKTIIAGADGFGDLIKTAGAIAGTVMSIPQTANSTENGNAEKKEVTPDEA
ncbi:hypothetical protein KKG48_00810, partial [Patescibacteria group bacterium]|nr:hypothetical protein [Patescibacteria group bacterium]